MACAVPHLRNKSSAPQRWTALRHPTLLLVFGFFLHRFHAAIVLRLGFGIFHRLLGFGNFLGAGFGALLFFLVENFFAAQQFEERFVGTVALVPAGVDDARVTA